MILYFSVEFLDGNSKNPQHLALQPMYVSSASLPSPPNHSNRSSVNSFSYERSRSNDRRPYGDNNADSRLPLYSFSHSSDTTRSVPRTRPKPKPNVHVDQIRKFTYDHDPLRTKSYDRLIRRESDGRNTEIVAKSQAPRPKSLYTNAFVE